MAKIIGLSCILLGVLGILHQKLFTGAGWFNWDQFWHHETLIAICLSLGIGVLFGGRR